MKIISLQGLFLVFNLLTSLRCKHDLDENEESFTQESNNHGVNSSLMTETATSHSEIRSNLGNFPTISSTVLVDPNSSTLTSTIDKDNFIDYLKNMEDSDSWSRKGYDKLERFLNLDFMMFKNSCGKVSRSCEASCGFVATKDETKNILTQSCSCDYICTVFDDCCQDFQEYCPEQLEYYQLYFTYLLGTSTSCSNSGYAVLSGCPPNSNMQITASDHNSSIKDTFLFTDTDNGIQYLNYSILRCHNVPESRATPWTKSIFHTKDDDQLQGDMTDFAFSVLNRTHEYIDIPPVTRFVPRLCNSVDISCSFDNQPDKDVSLETKVFAELCTNLEDYFRSQIIETLSTCRLTSHAGSRNTFNTIMSLVTNTELVLVNNDLRNGWKALSCHSDIANELKCDQKQCPHGKILVPSEVCEWVGIISVSYPMDKIDFESGLALLDAIDLGLTSSKQLILWPVDTKNVSINDSLVNIKCYQIKESLIKERNNDKLTITNLVKGSIIQKKDGEHDLPEWIEVCYTSHLMYEPTMTEMKPKDDEPLGWKICNELKKEDLLKGFGTKERSTGISYRLSFMTVIILDILVFFAI